MDAGRIRLIAYASLPTYLPTCLPVSACLPAYLPMPTYAGPSKMSMETIHEHFGRRSGKHLGPHGGDGEPGISVVTVSRLFLPWLAGLPLLDPA